MNCIIIDDEPLARDILLLVDNESLDSSTGNESL